MQACVAALVSLEALAEGPRLGPVVSVALRDSVARMLEAAHAVQFICIAVTATVLSCTQAFVLGAHPVMPLLVCQVHTTTTGMCCRHDGRP